MIEDEITQNQEVEFTVGEWLYTVWRRRGVGGPTRRRSWFDWTPIEIIPGAIVMNEQEREEKDNETERGGVAIWRACFWVLVIFLVGFCAWWGYGVLYAMGYRITW